jgi:D-amino-acid dehydrogenase
MTVARVAGTAPPVVVIGAGIVGMCTACALLRRGYAVTVVDRAGPGESTSRGNAGGIAVSEVVPLSTPGTMWRVPGWLFDPLGPLSIRWSYLPRLIPWLWRFWRAGAADKVAEQAAALADLLAPSYADYDPLLEAAGIRDILHRRGAMTIYESGKALDKDAFGWDLRREHGIAVERLDAGQIHEREPALAPIFPCAMLIPDWSHVGDPYRVVTALADWFRSQGGVIETGTVIGFDLADGRPVAVRLEDGRSLRFSHAVVAAGAWSKPLAAGLGSAVPLDTERGYNTTLPEPGVTLNAMITAGDHKFVFTPMDIGLRIGGAVELAGLDAPPNYGRAKAMLTIAKRYLPGLNTDGGTEWMGFRPSLPDSLPVIGPSPHHGNVFYAFGHAHLGLTEGATTGRVIADLIAGADPGFDVRPFRIDRF